MAKCLVIIFLLITGFTPRRGASIYAPWRLIAFLPCQSLLLPFKPVEVTHLALEACQAVPIFALRADEIFIVEMMSLPPKPSK